MTTIIKAAAASGQQLILDVRAPSNGGIAGGTMLFATVDSTLELALYSGNYNPATGIYTVPAGGHKNVRIRAELEVTQPASTNGSMQIQVNGVSKARVTDVTTATSSSQSLKAEAHMRNLVAGDQVKVIVNGGFSTSSNGGTGDFMQIFAT